MSPYSVNLETAATSVREIQGVVSTQFILRANGTVEDAIEVPFCTRPSRLELELCVMSFG